MQLAYSVVVTRVRRYQNIELLRLKVMKEISPLVEGSVLYGVAVF